MPLTIDNLTTGTPLEHTMEVAGEKLHVVFNPAAITGEDVQAAADAYAKGPVEGYLETVRQLSLLLVSWDLLARHPKKGEPKAKVPRVGTTPAALAKLPAAFVNQLVQELSQAARPPVAGSFADG